MRANRIRKIALLSGAAWTLLLAMMPGLFKSSWTWPISMLSLATVGLGWALILAWSIRRERREVRVALAADGGLSRSCVEAMARTLIGQMRGTRAELHMHAGGIELF